VVRTRMPGGVGGGASRDVPLSRSLARMRIPAWQRIGPVIGTGRKWLADLQNGAFDR
jgi:hypothetical protein